MAADRQIDRATERSTGCAAAGVNHMQIPCLYVNTCVYASVAGVKSVCISQ